MSKVWDAGKIFLYNNFTACYNTFGVGNSFPLLCLTIAMQFHVGLLKFYLDFVVLNECTADPFNLSCSSLYPDYFSS